MDIKTHTAVLAVAAAALNCACAQDIVGEIDFAESAGRIRPALHSSGWTPRSSKRAIHNDDNAIKALGMEFTRTHDWALVNAGQRIIDWHFIFPLEHLDATDPANYVFGPTDHIIELARNAGLKIFYRLGTSIEHTEEAHFNACVPKDFAKVAEVFAGTVRHYNKGWANGKKWNIEYWEIWNEPDGIANMWCLSDEEVARFGGRGTPAARKYARDRFIEFYVTCLRRLKTEFPEIKVGGPALCGTDLEYFRTILEKCRKAGVAPDFLSFHYYGREPDAMVQNAAAIRALCDKMGFEKCELICDEWHYLLAWDGVNGRNSTSAMVKRALDGPTGHNNIDSACFTLSSLVKFQSSKLDQAYFYGCAHEGNWGYMDNYKQFNKNFYACRMFGELVRGYPNICGSKSMRDTVSTLAAKSADGRRAALLVSDYRGIEQVLRFRVAGADGAKHVSARVLDYERDDIPVACDWHDGILTLVKNEKNSTAFMVEFEFP